MYLCFPEDLHDIVVLRDLHPGVLKRGECVVHTGGHFLHGPVFVARNPCYDPNELLHLTAVRPCDISCACPLHKAAALDFLAAQTATIVVSTQGTRAAAAGEGSEVREAGRSVMDELQNGDYDGDELTVVWEPSLLAEFKKEHQPVTYPSPEPCSPTVDELGTYV